MALVRVGRAVLVALLSACSRADVDEGIFFPRWSADDAPTAIVGGVLVEREGCLFLRSGETVALALWEDGYGFEEGSLIDSSGEPVAHVGEAIHGGGGHGSDRTWAEGIVGEPIPDRCIPEGVESFVLIYDVEPGPPG
ncbi:MAG: hypothetical protein L0206_02805 [Actinobacteria bacterium]|nr:hypothetical protein [Actinomycetota bacterium]